MSNNNKGCVSGVVTFVTSTLGNTTSGLTNTVGGVVGAAGRGVGETVNGVTGKTGDGIKDVANGIESGAASVAGGVKRTGEGRSGGPFS